MIRLKRIYDEPSDDGGCRVLVDRLWPRGAAKDRECNDTVAPKDVPEGKA